jgi:hypothetical protein
MSIALALFVSIALNLRRVSNLYKYMNPKWRFITSRNDQAPQAGAEELS